MSTAQFGQLTTRRRLLHFAAAGVLLYILATMLRFPYGDREIKWTETVLLSSGETVSVHRVQRVEVHLTSEGRSGNLAKMATVTSDRDPPAFPPWQAPMLPILLDRDPDTGAWVLIATMFLCDVWGRNGQPKPPYWGFRVVDGQWRRAGIPASFWDRPANLFAALQAIDSSSTVRSSYDYRRRAQNSRGAESSLAGVWRDGDGAANCGRYIGSNAIELDLWQYGAE